MRFRYIIVALLCPCFYLFAQKPLSIGDTVPDIEFLQLFNYPAKTARLSDFKGKLLILDFWASSCGSCLHSFFKMDSLQTVFADQVKILLVNNKSTRDDLAKVQHVFTKWEARAGKKLGLTTVVNDTITENLFPHYLLPHYVWIGQTGRVIAITGEVNASSIRNVLDGLPLGLNTKKDQPRDRPVFASEDLPVSNLLNYAVFTKGWNEGLPSGGRATEKNGIICGRAITNTSLFDMFKNVVKKIEPSFTDKQLVVITNDSTGFFAPPPGSEARKDWYKEHAYTLQVIVPTSEADVLSQRLLEVLNQYSGYTGQFERREMCCWVLMKKHEAVHLRSKGGKAENRLWDKEKPGLTNTDITSLINHLNRSDAIKNFVVNETGYAGNIDLKIDSSGFNDLQSIQQNLLKNGLALTQQVRLVKVFVIRKG